MERNNAHRRRLDFLRLVLPGRAKPSPGLRLPKLFFFLFFLFALNAASASEVSGGFQTPPMPQPLPPLVFEDENGIQHSLSEYRGRFVVLNIWASWCGSCVEEMPSLEKLQGHFDPQKLVVLPLSEERAAARLKAFYRAYGLTHLPIAIDMGGRATSILEVDGLPTTLILDPSGREIARIVGGIDWNKPEIVRYFESLLSPNASM